MLGVMCLNIVSKFQNLIFWLLKEIAISQRKLAAFPCFKRERSSWGNREFLKQFAVFPANSQFKGKFSRKNNIRFRKCRRNTIVETKLGG